MRVVHESNDVQPFQVNVQGESTISELKEKISEHVSTQESKLDVHRILLAHVEENFTPDIVLSNEKSCNESGLENGIEVQFFKWNGTEVLPPNGIPTQNTSENIEENCFKEEEKVESSANQSVLNELSWGPLFEQMVKHDKSGDKIKNSVVPSDPAEIFLNNFQLPFASAWPGWDNEDLKSAEKFFEKLKDLQIKEYGDTFQKMREHLARNCNLKKDKITDREKKKILALDKADRIAENQWTPYVTFNKLHEMTKTSHFRGFEHTRQSGQDFIMDKAVFLFYLAYIKRNEEIQLNSGKSNLSSLLDIISGKKIVDEKQLQDIEGKTEFKESREKSGDKAATAGKTMTAQLDLLLTMDAEPSRILDLFKGGVDIEPRKMIGCLCQHTNWSYRLDTVLNRLVSKLIANYPSKKNNEQWVQDVCSLLMWVGVIRGSLEDLVHLCNILDTTQHKIDLQDDLAFFFNNPKYDLFGGDQKNALQIAKVDSTLEEVDWKIPQEDRVGSFQPSVMQDSKQFYVVKDDQIFIVNKKLDTIPQREKFEHESFEELKVNKKENLHKNYLTEALGNYLLFLRLDENNIPQECFFVDKQTLKVIDGVSAFDNDVTQLQNIVKALKAGKNKVKKIVFDEQSQTLYFYCMDRNKKHVKIFSYDARKNFNQQKNSPLRPNFEVLFEGCESQDQGMMGIHSGIAFFFIAEKIAFISLESGEFMGRSRAEKGMNWFDKATGSFLNYRSGILTSFKPKGLPGFAQNFLPELAPKMKKLVFAKKASSQIKNDLLQSFVGLSKQKSKSDSSDELNLTNREQSFVISQLLATINEDFEKCRFVDGNPLGLVKKPLQTWQTISFYEAIHERIGCVFKNYSNLQEADQVHEIIKALNFAKLLFNNLKSLLQTKTQFSTLMGSEEVATDFFYKASANVLTLQILVQQKQSAIPSYHISRCSKIWEGFTSLMGDNKVVKVSAQSILDLLKPIQQRADAEFLISTPPVLNLLSQHLQHVTQNEQLFSILNSSVSGILKSEALGKSTSQIIKVIEQAALTLLEQPKTMSEKEMLAYTRKQEKTLDFIRMNFKISMQSVLNMQKDSVSEETIKAYAVVLKTTSLIRSLKDSSALQQDFVELLQDLNGAKLSLLVDTVGDQILLKDCLQTMGLRIAELVNFDKKSEEAKKASMQGTRAYDEHLQADLIIQSNLLSSGFENRFLSQLYTDEKEMKEILELEATNAIAILPEKVSKFIRQKSESMSPLKIPSSTQLSDSFQIDTGSEAKSPLDQSENEKDQMLNAVIHEGKQKNLDELISAMQFWLTKQRGPAGRSARLGQALGMRLTRAAFAVTIKLAGKATQFIDLQQDFDDEVSEKITDQKGAQRDMKLKEILESIPQSKEILGHWQNAAKMRSWFQNQKLIIAEDVSKQIKSQAQSKNWDEAEQTQQADLSEEKKQHETVQAVVNKAAFLVMIKTPQSFQTQDVDAAELKLGVQRQLLSMMKKKSQQAGAFDGTKTGDQQTKEEWNEAFKDWKNQISSKGQKSEAETRNDLRQAGTAAVLACLQNPMVKIEKIQSKLKDVYNRASRRLAGMNLLRLLSHKFVGFTIDSENYSDKTNQFIKSTLNDVLGWFSSIQIPDEGEEEQLEQFHYLDDVIGCGVQLEDKLKDTFFLILEQMTKLLSWSSKQDLKVKENYMFTRFVLSVFQWNFLARDYQSLQKRLGIFHFLNSGEDVKNTSIEQVASQGQFINFWIDPRSQLSKDLLVTFEDIFLSITRRIADADRKTDKTPSSPLKTMARQESKIDVSSTTIMFRNAFNLIFRQMSNFVYVSKRIDEDKSICTDQKECDIYAPEFLNKLIKAQQDVNDKKEATITDTEWFGDQNADNNKDYEYPKTEDIQKIAFKDLPTIKEIAWDNNGSIRVMQWTMSDEKVSEKAGGGSIEFRKNIEGSQIRQIKIFNQSDYDKVGRVHFLDENGKHLMGDRGLHSDNSCRMGSDDVKVVDLSLDEKLVGLRVRHDHGNPVRGISFKIAKRAPIDKELSDRLESVEKLQKVPDHLMAHDSPPDDPKVQVDYRITEIYGYHEGHTKTQFPELAQIINKPYKKMNKIKRVKFDTNGALRCVQWWMEDGTTHPKVGGYDPYYDRSFEENGTYKKVSYILMQKRMHEQQLGRIKFYDENDDMIFKMEGSSSMEDQVMRCDIAKDETLAGFDWYTCTEAIRGVSFIIIKEKSSKPICPRVTAGFDLITKMLVEKYQVNSDNQNPDEEKKAKELDADLKEMQKITKKGLMNIYRNEIESAQVIDCLQMVLIFTSAAQKALAPLEVLSHVANSSNITTLLELLIDSSPIAKMTILSIIKNLVRINVPQIVFAEGMKNFKPMELKVQPLVKFNNKLVELMYSLAVQIRTRSWSSRYTEEAGGLYGVSVRLIRTASLIYKTQSVGEDDFSQGFVHLLEEREKDDPAKRVQIREELNILFEFVGAQLQTAITGDLLIKTQTSGDAAGLNQSETCRSELKDNVEALYGHEISLKEQDALNLHLGEDVCAKFMEILNQDLEVTNKTELRQSESLNVLQAQICKYFILHLNDLETKMSKEQMQELAQLLFRHSTQDQLRGYLQPPEQLKYAPWVFEHAYARSIALLVDKQTDDKQVDGLVRLEQMREKLQMSLMQKVVNAKGSQAGSEKGKKKDGTVTILFRTRSDKGDSEDEGVIDAPDLKKNKSLAPAKTESLDEMEIKKKETTPEGQSLPLSKLVKTEKEDYKFKEYTLSELTDVKNQRKVSERIKRVRKYINQTGALLPEVVLQLLKEEQAQDAFRAKLNKFADTSQQSGLLNQERCRKYQSFLLQSLIDCLLTVDSEEFANIMQNEYVFDDTAQKVQSGFLIIELPKSQELSKIWDQIWDDTNKAFEKWQAGSEDKADGLKHKADKVTIIEGEMIEKVSNELKSFGTVHVLNAQLKRKLLNKILYKFTETVLSPRKDSQVESDINTGVSAVRQDAGSSLKLLWFGTQHLASLENCRDSSSGVECAWQDPDEHLTDQHWKLLLYKVSTYEAFGPTIINQLIFRTIGQITRELHIWMEVMASKPLIDDREATLAERSDLTSSEENTSKANICASLACVFNWSSVIKTIRSLEFLIMMFSEKHDEEAWKKHKSQVLFTPVNGGPSLLASMVQIYLNIAVNLYALFQGAETTKNFNRPEKIDEHLYMRRGVFESIFRLIDMVARSDFSSEDILKYTLQPLFESDMLKRLAIKVAEQIKDGAFFTKGIFNHLCADLTCQAVTAYVVIARKIFANGTIFRVKVDASYMNLASLVVKGKVLPDKKGLADALAFLKEIARKQLDDSNKDIGKADATELISIDINCAVRRGQDGRLEGIEQQEILNPIVTFETQYSLNIVDAKSNKRVYSHLFAEIGDSQNKQDYQWLPSSALKELANKSEEFEGQVTLDSNYASIHLPSQFFRVLVNYQFNSQGEIWTDEKKSCAEQNKSSFKSGGQIPHQPAQELWLNDKMDPESLLAVSKDELFFCSPSYENTLGQTDQKLRVLSLSGDRKGKVSVVKTPLNTKVQHAILPIQASSRTKEQKEEIKKELTVKLAIVGQKSTDKYGQCAKQIKEVNKKWDEMTLEIKNLIKKDINDLEKDEFVESINSSNIVYLLFDLTDRKTLDTLMQKVGPWILEQKECSANFVLIGTNCEERMRRLIRNEKEDLFTTSKAVLLQKYNAHSQSVNQKDLLADYLEVEFMREEQLLEFQKLIEPSLTHKFKNYVAATKLRAKETIIAFSTEGKGQALHSDVNRILEFTDAELLDEAQKFKNTAEGQQFTPLKSWDQVLPEAAEVSDVAFTADCRLFAMRDGTLRQQGLRNLIGTHTLAQRWEWAATDASECGEDFLGDLDLSMNKVKRVWQHIYGESRVAFIYVTDSDNVHTLYSYGQCELGMLAQGSGVNKSEKFAKCLHEGTKEHNEIFKDLFFVDSLVMAITNDGEIWVIGGEDFIETVSNEINIEELDNAEEARPDLASFSYIKFEDDRQLYINPSGWATTELSEAHSNTDDARRLWKFEDSLLTLQDGRQLYVNPDGWAGVALPETHTNTEDARRKWKFEDGYLTLQDGSQLYTNPSAWAGTAQPGTHTNTEDSRRKWTFENVNLELAEEVAQKPVEEQLKLIEVLNAGTESANGIYERSEEIERGQPIWKKRGGNAHIQFWDNSCGWELYHDGLYGMGGTCTYWTNGRQDLVHHKDADTNPVKPLWYVRGGNSPAPTVRYFNENNKNTVFLEARNYSDSTASDSWRATDGKETQPIAKQVGSITCEVVFKDQGWGNRKGRVKVALVRDGVEIAEESLFTEAAAHEWETKERILVHESVVKKAQQGDTYALYHAVGGGGGHEIHIESFRILVEYKSEDDAKKKEQAGLNGADPKYQAISIYEPLETGLMQSNNLKAVRIAPFCSGPNFRAKLVLAEDADGNRSLYKSHGPQNASLTRLELGEIQVRDFIVSSHGTVEDPANAVHNVFMVSDLTQIKKRLESGELKAQLVSRAVPGKFSVAEKGKGPHASLMKEIDEAFPRANFEQTLTRILTMLNYRVDAAKETDRGKEIAAVISQLEAVKAELESRLGGEDSKVAVKKEDLNKILGQFDGESRKTVLSLQLALSIMHVNQIMGKEKDNCVRSDPWRYEQGKMRKGSLTCAGLANLQSANGFLLNNILAERVEVIQNSMEQNRDKPDLRVRRIFASKFQASGEVDHNQTASGQTMFTQSLRQFKPSNYKHFLKNSMKERSDRPFKVYFKGEGSIDDGGPLRETFDFFCVELQTASLPILIPTENRRGDVGEMRERFILNPDCGKGEYAVEELDMLHYFGVLIGFALRTTNPMPLNLHPIFWKMVVDKEYQVTESDLFYTDQHSWKMLTDIRKARNAYEDEDFEAAMDQTFVFATRNSDGTEGEEIELCAGGKQRRLTRQNTEEFIALTIKAILNRALPQMAKVREGIELICGKELPYVLSWRYCEERVVGKTETDVEYLKRFTNYEDHFNRSDSKCKTWFWEIMHEMTEEDRQLYLRFVNGQAKLPSDLNSLAYKHTLRGKGGSGDNSLPEAHTCYNQLDCPEYSSKEIMRQRITTAIRWCGEVDNDGSPEQY